jgi:hypothetical protein
MSDLCSDSRSELDLDNDMIDIVCEACDMGYEFCDQMDRCDTCADNNNDECNLCPHCGVRLSLFQGVSSCSDAIVCDIMSGRLNYCFHPDHELSKWLMCSDTKHLLDHGSRIVKDPDTLIILLAVENPVMKSTANERIESSMDLNRCISRINNPVAAVVGSRSTRFLTSLFPTLPDL